MTRRADRDRRRELARLEALTPEQRRAEVAALAADALTAPPSPRDVPDQDRTDALSAAVQAPTVEELVARELARAREAERQAAEAADFERGRCPSGACALCGLESVLVVDAANASSPGWHVQDGQHVCEQCWRDLFDGTVAVTADDRREATMRRLLGRREIPLAAMARPDLFRDIPLWWHEHPGAAPARTLDERFAHVDRAELARAYDAVVTHAGHGPPGEPPALPVSDPCPACGAGPERHYRMDSRMVSGPICGGCGWTRQLVEHWPNEDGTTRFNIRDHTLPAPGRPGERTERDVDAAVLLGLPLEVPSFGPDGLAGLAERVGFAYWAETGRQHPNERPWQHVDVERMRRKAAVPA